MAFGRKKEEPSGEKPKSRKEIKKEEKARKEAEKQAEKDRKEQEKLQKALAKKGSNPELRSRAEELYQRAQDENMFSSLFDPEKKNVKETALEKLENMVKTLRPDEEIQSVFIVGIFISSAPPIVRPAPILLTDNRLICETRQGISIIQKAIQLDDISDITSSKTLGFKEIMVDSLRDRLVFQVGSSEEELNNFMNALQDSLTNHRNLVNQASVNSQVQAQAANQPQISVADELLKFKQLLDMGAITQEEFDKKKSELL